ncbi:hypothetical protein [Myceligenerans cantabricum]
MTQVAEALGSPIRVEVHDSGHTYADVVVPAAPATPTALHETADDGRPLTTPLPMQAMTGAPSTSALRGRGFASEEPVAIAVVVATTQADAEGSVQLRMPPALRGRATSLLLYGTRSAQARYLPPAHNPHVDPGHAPEPQNSQPARTADRDSSPTTDPLQPVDDAGLADETALSDEEVGAP